ncbi:MAG: GTP cyclohydrolase I FolE2 [Chromatiales bacterium]|nr:GTP cyclohydrolase I FolE2 [Chromatiales bacterium]
MIATLPDVARTAALIADPSLDWVGMRDIELPVRLAPAGIPSSARADIFVDLPANAGRGIHMSRLYLLLHEFVARASLSPPELQELLQDAVQTHADCQSTRARVVIHLDHLVERPALVTPGLTGWRSYPITVTAEIRPQLSLAIRLTVKVSYSSTCPCSAALARQVLESRYLSDFSARSEVSPADTAQWLRKHGSVATPHSQRSTACVTVSIPEDATDLGVDRLIERIEEALGTPVQTAVKRADEQAFAELNGANLMYVEDAARRLQQALASRYNSGQIRVQHHESLHPHDAFVELSFG